MTDEDVLDLRELFGVLRRHLLLLCAVTAAVTVLAGVVAYRSKPAYLANAVIRVADTRRAMTAGLDNPIVDNALGSQTDPVLSQVQVLQSRGVAAQVVATHPLGLRVLADGFPPSDISAIGVDSEVEADTLTFEFAGPGFTVHGRSGSAQGTYGAPMVLDGLKFALAVAPSQNTGQLVVVSREAAINNLLRNLDAKVRKSTDVIDVSYKNTDPTIAREVVNTAVATFQKVNASTAQQESRRRREFVQEQLAQTDSILTQAQLALSNFASTRQVYGSDQKIAAEQSGLMDLDMKRGELTADRAMYRSLLDSLTAAEGQHLTERLNAVVSSPDVAKNPVVQALYQQLVAYEAVRDSITVGPWANAPGNPDVKRLDALIATTQQRLTGATRSQIDALSARISALDALKSTTAAELQKLPATQVAEARLVQRVEAARKVSDQLRDEFQKARIAEAVEAGQVEIVDPAPRPLNPISKGPLLKTVLGLMVGLMFGMGAAFLSENLNTAIQRRDEIESVLRVPGLAIIPQILPSNGARHTLRFAAGSTPPESPRLIGGRNGTSAALVAANDGHSPGAEAFRTLRTSLIFSQAVQSLRTIVVTSASPEEGKTTTIANLAVTFAQQGLRVVLMDCDLRKARLHAVFGVPREPGLTNVMLGQAPLDDVVRATAVEGLFFLSAGALPPNPAELLGGPQMKDVLERLRERYDIVLIDTPPVHAATDALILGRAADGVLVVVRAGRTDRAAAQDAMRGLASVGANVVGAVLNDPDHKVPAYGGYYHYDYYGSTDAEPAGTRA